MTAISAVPRTAQAGVARIPTGMVGSGPSGTASLTGTATGVVGSIPLANRTIPDGQFSSVVYGLIANQKYDEAKKVLEDMMEKFPGNRAALSLLGYVTFMMRDYTGSQKWYFFFLFIDVLITPCSYEQLIKKFPSVTDYKLNYAQALQKDGKYNEAMQVCLTIKDPEFAQKA